MKPLLCYANNPSSMLVAALASVGALVSPIVPTVTTASIAPTEVRQPVAAIANGTSSRQIQQDHFGSYSAGMFDSLMRDTGMNPRDWGMSRACQRMVRRSHLRGLGIGRRRG